MQKLLPLLCIGVIGTAVVQNANSANQVNETIDHGAPVVRVVQPQTKANLLKEYQQFAMALAKYQKTKTTVIPKGQKRSPTSVFKANLITKTVTSTKAANDVLPVFNHSDILPKHQKIASDALKQLPEQCWDTLKNFYVRYDNPKSRGLAGAETMILSGNVNDDEFRALFMHEIGHVFDLNQRTACLGGTAASGASAFKDGAQIMYNDDPSVEFYSISWQDEDTMKSSTPASHFVSGYAATNIFEDFAESHTLFVLHNDEFRAIAKDNPALTKKYNFFAKYMYPNNIAISDSEYTPTAERVWDTTKLPYNWLPG